MNDTYECEHNHSDDLDEHEVGGREDYITVTQYMNNMNSGMKTCARTFFEALSYALGVSVDAGSISEHAAQRIVDRVNEALGGFIQDVDKATGNDHSGVS